MRVSAYLTGKQSQDEGPFQKENNSQEVLLIVIAVKSYFKSLLSTAHICSQPLL